MTSCHCSVMYDVVSDVMYDVMSEKYVCCHGWDVTRDVIAEKCLL